MDLNLFHGIISVIIIKYKICLIAYIKFIWLTRADQKEVNEIFFQITEFADVN